MIGRQVSFEPSNRIAEMVSDSNNKSKSHKEKISYLLECSRTVLEFCKFKDTAHSIFFSCKKLLGNTLGSIILLSKNGTQNDVQFFHLEGLPCPADPRLIMPLRTIHEKASHSVKAVYTNDISKSIWAKYLPKSQLILLNILFAPLIINGNAVG